MRDRDKLLEDSFFGHEEKIRNFVLQRDCTMTRAEDLAELGLADTGDVDDRDIRKAYLRLSRSRHPDKEGSKESFQLLVNAYERLRSGAYHDDASQQPDEEDAEQEDSYEYEIDYWYGEHLSFFGQAWGYKFGDESEYEEYFENWREAAKARARQRREDLRQGYDYCDRKAAPEDEKCMFCGVNQPISETEAKANGLSWDEYSAHPERLYKTCWVCKDNIYLS